MKSSICAVFSTIVTLLRREIPSLLQSAMFLLSNRDILRKLSSLDPCAMWLAKVDHSSMMYSHVSCDAAMRRTKEETLFHLYLVWYRMPPSTGSLITIPALGGSLRAISGDSRGRCPWPENHVVL